MFCSIMLTGELAFDWISLAADKSAGKAENLPENSEVRPEPPVEKHQQQGDEQKDNKNLQTIVSKHREVVSCGRTLLIDLRPAALRASRVNR